MSFSNAGANDAAGPLSGIRVLDFTAVMSGPYCTRLLADMGAEVIKIEPPEGDHKRAVPPTRDGHSTAFAQVNAGKKSVVLDLKSAAGKRAAHALAQHSDVVVENWRPGVSNRLGFDYAALATKRPDIIYCALSGFGQTGPDAGRPAYAPIIHAASGFDLAQMRYDPSATRPVPNGIFIADVFAGMSAFAAINAALFQRQRTGRGQFIDVSLFDGMLNMLVFEWHEAQFFAVPRRIYPPLRASDGYVVVAPVSQKNFQGLARCLGRPEWLDDERFANPALRIQHWTELMEAIELWTGQRTAAQCEAIMRAEDVPCSRYRSVAECLVDPHLAQRGTLANVHDGAGSVTIPTAPYQMPGTNVRPRDRVPDLGADTVQVLKDVAGLDDGAIAACIERASNR